MVSCAALPLGLSTSAIGSLITFGGAATFVPFFVLTLVALTARLRGRWTPAGAVRYGRLGTPLNLLAVLWTGFEVVNICWPRAVLSPAGAPWYQIWAAPLGVGTVTLTGLGYLLARRPDRRMGEADRDLPLTEELAPAVVQPLRLPGSRAPRPPGRGASGPFTCSTDRSSSTEPPWRRTP